MNKKPIIIIVVSVVFLSAILIAIFRTGGECNGQKCKGQLGLAQKENVNKRNDRFRNEYPKMANRVNVYVESSASMDGYVNGHTDFKTMVHRLVGQLKTDVLKSGNKLSLNYITSEVTNVKVKDNQFSNNMSPSSFHSSKGDRANSKITDMIREVVDSTKAGDVSMFVSDCVFSPEPGDSIFKALAMQRTDMLNILKNKAKTDNKFGVLVYRVESDFHGIYYTKTNAEIQCNGQRPYFVWFFGDENILGNVYASISGIMDESKAQYIVGIPAYEHIPYETPGSKHTYHYMHVKTDSKSEKRIKFIADMSYLPLSKEYIKNPSNYSYGNKKNYKITSIKEYSNPKKPGFNYEFEVTITGGKREELPSTFIEISLKSMFANTPKWIEKFDDPTGDDYNNGYNPQKLRTFGIKSLIDGISDYYKSQPYVTFKILIN